VGWLGLGKVGVREYIYTYMIVHILFLDYCSNNECIVSEIFNFTRYFYFDTIRLDSGQPCEYHYCGMVDNRSTMRKTWEEQMIIKGIN
jgi:hypothetical protein